MRLLFGGCVNDDEVVAFGAAVVLTDLRVSGMLENSGQAGISEANV